MRVGTVIPLILLALISACAPFREATPELLSELNGKIASTAPGGKVKSIDKRYFSYDSGKENELSGYDFNVLLFPEIVNSEYEVFSELSFIYFTSQKEWGVTSRNRFIRFFEAPKNNVYLWELKEKSFSESDLQFFYEAIAAQSLKVKPFFGSIQSIEKSGAREFGIEFSGQCPLKNDKAEVSIGEGKSILLKCSYIVY
jgi:hypothetical protein